MHIECGRIIAIAIHNKDRQLFGRTQSSWAGRGDDWTGSMLGGALTGSPDSEKQP